MNNTSNKSWADEMIAMLEPEHTCELPEHVRTATSNALAAGLASGAPIEEVIAATTATTNAEMTKLAARDRVCTVATPSFQPTEDEEKRKELREKQGKLLNSFYVHLKSSTELALEHAGEQCCWLLGEYSLPRRDCPPRLAYWAGDGDVRRDGVPFVQLLQGVRDHKTGIVYPELLPGGKTVVKLLNEALQARGIACELFKPPPARRGEAPAPDFCLFATRSTSEQWAMERANLMRQGYRGLRF